MANIIYGKEISNKIKEELKQKISLENIKPKLVVIIVGNDKSSIVYTNMEIKACKNVGIETELHHFEENTTESKIIDLIMDLNADDTVHAIMLKMPLPKHIDENKVVGYISIVKDVDCLNPYNLGKLFKGNPKIIPCTAKAVMKIIDFLNIDVKGKNVVIVGRSDIVGKPLLHLFLDRSATVTIAHSKTINLEKVCSSADILCVAIGKANFIKGNFVKSGATVIDIGINLEDGKITGDIAFDEATHAENITPVPAGVGPITIAMLMENLYYLYKQNN